MAKGRGRGSVATQFKRVLESQPIAYYQRGERKGQPKICSLCPSFVHVSSSKMKLCPAHLRAFHAQRNKRNLSTNRRHHVAAILHITTPSPKPLRAYKQRAQRRDYVGLFGHIPDNYQDIARHELQLMLTKHPNPSTPRYAAMVASATAMAKYGGRAEWAKAMLQKRLQKGYWRKQLSEGGVNL
jgi:hypothetical protein